MLGGVWLVYASFGLIHGGIPPLVVYINGDLSLTRAAMGSVLGAWQLSYIAFAVPAGALTDRLGLPVSLTLCAVLMALSGLLRAFAVNHATLFLAVALFGLGGPFISIGAPKLISAWFDPKERGAAMGLYMTAPAVGRIVALSTANSILMPLYGSSWRLTLATYAGFALLAGVIWRIIARDLRRPDGNSREFGASHAVGTTSQAGPTGYRVFPELLRLPIVRIIMIMSLGAFLFNHGLNSWLPEILRLGGMSAKLAGFWATVPVAIGLAATIIIPRLAVPHRRIPILVASLLVASVAMMIIGTSTGSIRILGLILVGIATRGVMPILMLILIDSPQVGSRRTGSAGGLFFTAGEVGGVLGPLLMGVLSDATGDFGGGLLMLAGVSVSMAILALWLGFTLKRRR
jgi:CP family cyanate transporter-like MFS transporter